MVELLGNILAEGIAGSSGRNSPAASIIRVGPEEIADRAFMGHFLHSVKLSDLVQGVDGRRETSVQTEDLVFDNGSKREVVEEFSESSPHIGVSVLS